ncbi:hypothetical protein EJB05_39877, partial [Eragrostis curvula]
MAASSALPVVDLAPFFADGDEGGVARATEAVREACRSHGFFRAVNHGVPSELMARALELSAAFFALPDEEKAKVRPAEGFPTPIPAGYGRQPAHSADKSEYVLVFNPKLGFNAYPDEPAGFRSCKLVCLYCVHFLLRNFNPKFGFNAYPDEPAGFRSCKLVDAVEECFAKLTDLGLLIQDILNDCMGLPPGFLKNYNSDRNFDFMSAKRYFPATEGESNNGISQHEDGNCITFILQDSVGGLEVLKDGHWVQAEPVDGSIIVNIGDVIQALSNKKLKSATHRVVRKAVHRHSFAFFFGIHGDKWIEPLPEFTDKVGEAPRYRGFLYKEYEQLRVRNKTHPPSRAEDVIDITHHAI